mgnify:CR=1 FL=1|jgi:ABC-type transporter Mla subunit MlaD
MALPEDERKRYRAALHQARKPVPNWLIGVLLLLVATLGPYLAFRKHIPFTGYGYELEAVFKNSLQVTAGSPVRVAGVNVGEVIESEREGNHTRVRFFVEDEGRPIHEDASVKLRPRMFFEGNWFLELDPGSPSVPELEDGGTIPVSRTASAVQLDEILTSLQKQQRDELGELLIEYGTALNHRPTSPAENEDFERIVRGKTGAEALNLSLRYGGDASRSSARVLEAMRGTKGDDLGRLLSGAERTFGALAEREEDLRRLLANWERFTAALADESENLGRTFAELDPTLDAAQTSLRNFSASLPPLRAWARELGPSLEPLPATIAAGQPWLEQAELLLREREGGGAVRLLRQATPGLAQAAHHGIRTIREIRLLSRCTSEVLVPTGNQVINDEFSIGEPNYREFFYAAANLAGEGANFDGNGPYLALMPTVGDVLVKADYPNAPPEQSRFGKTFKETPLFAHTTLPPKGSQPQLGGLPPFKPRVPCHRNSVPDLNSGLGQPGPPSPAPVSP